MRHAMIMAGGSGTRLWPISRLAKPKQLLPLVAGKSLLEIASERLSGVVPPERRMICTGERFRTAIEEVISSIEVLGEPCGRDTLNAVGLTATVLAIRDPEAVFAVLTADHVIKPHDAFAKAMEIGFQLVEADPKRLVTFGITPSYPATGYGYVGCGTPVPDIDGAFQASGFKEKPDEETARSYLADGSYMWNSGMFVFSAQCVLDAIAEFHPEAHAGLKRIGEAWGTPQQSEVLEAVYPTLPKTSVDYGLMEPTAAATHYEVCVVPMQVEWHDIGSWPSLAETIEEDADGNRVNGTAVLEDCRGVLAFSDNDARIVTAIGCQDMIIVATDDAVLVCPSDRAEQVKAIAGKVPESHR